mgnify:CR=1 FL=1
MPRKAAAPQAETPAKASASASEKAFEAFAAKMDKTYGQGVFTAPISAVKYEVISTGSISLDYYLGCGGLPEGRIHEIWGPESAGKSTLAAICLREAQRKHPDKAVAIIDVEHRVDLAWLIAHGLLLGPTRFLLVKPITAEDVADQLKDICKSGLFSAVVVDSVGAMLAKAAHEKDAGDSTMGKDAQVVTRMVKLNAAMAESKGTAILLINQVRANFNYGSDTTTGGGFALKHASTIKLFVKRATGDDSRLSVKIKGEDRVVGYKMSVKIERNSVAPAYRTASFFLITVPTEKYGPVGIDRVDEAVTVGLLSGVIKQSGAWYTTPDDQRYQGRPAVVDALRQRPEVVELIRSMALETMADSVHPDVQDEEESDGSAVDYEDPSVPPTKGLADLAARVKAVASKAEAEAAST